MVRKLLSWILSTSLRSSPVSRSLFFCFVLFVISFSCNYLSHFAFLMKQVFDLHRHHIDQITIPSCRGPEFGVLRRVEDVRWIPCSLMFLILVISHLCLLLPFQVFDCWFESGSMPYAYIHYPFENKELFEKNFPGHFVAEGLDQTRGWYVQVAYKLSITISLGLLPPFNVLDGLDLNYPQLLYLN